MSPLKYVRGKKGSETGNGIGEVFRRDYVVFRGRLNTHEDPMWSIWKENLQWQGGVFRC